MLDVIIKPSAEKQLDRLPTKVRSKIVTALDALGMDPRPAGCRKLAAEDNFWRIRVGSYRVVYEIDDERLVVLILRVGHCKDVYRGL